MSDNRIQHANFLALRDGQSRQGHLTEHEIACLQQLLFARKQLALLPGSESRDGNLEYCNHRIAQLLNLQYEPLTIDYDAKAPDTSDRPG